MLQFQLLPIEFAICRFASDQRIPNGVTEASFYAVTRTEDELSVVLPAALVEAQWQSEAGWRALKIQGPLDFGMVGVIAKISSLLALHQIPIFVISTFDTDYILVKIAYLNKSLQVLKGAGHAIF